MILMNFKKFHIFLFNFDIFFTVNKLACNFIKKNYQPGVHSIYLKRVRILERFRNKQFRINSQHFVRNEMIKTTKFT